MQSPRLSRYFNWEQIQYLPAPVGGWNPTTNPWEMADDQAQRLDNFIVRDARIVERAPLNASEDIALNITGTYTSGPINPVGIVLGLGNTPSSDWLQITRGPHSGTGLIDPWNAVACRTTGSTLSVPDAHIIAFNSAVNPVSVACSADQAPGPRWIDFDGLLYGLSYGASTAPTTYADTNATYTARATNLLTLPLRQNGQTLATVMTGAPRGAFDLKGYQSRIWLLGGVDTPGALTAHEATTLFFSNPIISGGGATATDWKDPVAGTTNKIRMDNDISDYGVGLAVCRSGLLIFRRNSVWLLRGSDPSNYSLMPVTREVGCVDSRTIVETDAGVYFMSHRGLMLTNGTGVINASGAMQHVLEEAIAYYVAQVLSPTSTISGWATLVRTSQGQLIFSLGLTSFSGLEPIFAAMLDPAQNVWTGISSQIYQNGADAFLPSPFGIMPATLYPTMFAQRDNPHKIVTVGNKYVTLWEDIAVSISFLSPYIHPHSVVPCYDVVPASFGSPPSIPLWWRTRLVATVTATRRVNAQAKRWFMDYQHQTDSLTAGALANWIVTPIDRTATALSSPVTLTQVTTAVYDPNGPINFVSVSGNPMIQRQNVDFFSELPMELAFDITQDPTPGSHPVSAARNEIYGLGVEFVQGRELR